MSLYEDMSEDNFTRVAIAVLRLNVVHVILIDILIETHQLYLLFTWGNKLLACWSNAVLGVVMSGPRATYTAKNSIIS